MVGGKARRGDQVTVLAAALGGRLEAVTDLHALDRIDAHQRAGQLGRELAVDRLTPARRYAFGNHVHARTDRIAGLAQRIHVGLQRRHLGRVRPEERVVLHRRPVKPGRAVLAQLGQVPAHRDPVALGQPFLGDHPGRHPHGGLTGRGTAATARVTDTVFVPVGIVGMARTELRGDVAVVLAALVGVADQQRDRGASGQALVHPGQDFHLVGLTALGGVARAPGGAALQIKGELLRADRQPRGATIDHAANGRTVGFTKGGDGEQLAEGVGAHRAAASSAMRAW